MITIPFSHWLVLLSSFIGLIGAYFYIRDTVKGKTKPNRVSWAMWALAPLLGAAVAFNSGADFWATLRIFLAGFIPFLIFLASFLNPKSSWKLTPFDFICGALSLAALAIWEITDSPRSAILLLVIADSFASIPTFFKAWRSPETETGVTYFTGLIGILLIIPSVPVWNIENSAFQIYLLISNSLLFLAVYRRYLFIPSRLCRKQAALGL